MLTGFIWDGKSGGIDACLTAFAQAATREGIHIDFLTNSYSESLAQELEVMGHRLFEIATLRDRASQKAAIAELCRNTLYDAAYFNVSTALMYPVVRDARKAGVRKIVVHAHAAGNDQANIFKRVLFDALNSLLRCPLRKVSTHMLACSREAACWLFGEGAVRQGAVRIVANPVDAYRCSYDERIRQWKREELGLADKLVIGSVTAMKEVKNPFLLIDIFSAVYEQRPDAFLAVVGGGELSDAVKKYAEEKLVAGSYAFFGLRQDVPELLQAFDAFILPSRKEGLSIATIEAQSAGLPCVVSSGVPLEAIVVPELGRQVPLSSSVETWRDVVLDVMSEGLSEASARKSYAEVLEQAGYSLKAPEKILDMIK